MNASQTATPFRTHSCGELRLEHAGAEASLAGWVDSLRDHGEGLVFVDLRDHAGVTQIVFDREDTPEELVEQARTLRSEDVVRAAGFVRKRDGGPNPRLATGEIELVARSLTVLNKAVGLPFSPTDPESLPG
ncbi:MAG: aspartate--tRNA ligase, partial [Planctomycetota bacterium]